MPLYEYRCNKCEHVFSDMLKMDDRHLPTEQSCPNCKEEKCVEQLISAVALVSPFSIDGLKKPGADFKQRMHQIKDGFKNTSISKNIKDY